MRQLVVAERVVEDELEGPRRGQAHRDLDQHGDEHDHQPAPVGPDELEHQARQLPLLRGCIAGSGAGGNRLGGGFGWGLAGHFQKIDNRLKRVIPSERLLTDGSLAKVSAVAAPPDSQDTSYRGFPCITSPKTPFLPTYPTRFERHFHSHLIYRRQKLRYWT